MLFDFFDPSIEEQIVMLIEGATVRRAERMIESCDQCDPDAEIPFDTVIDQLTGAEPSRTEYLLESPAKCPNCHRDVFEKSLVEPR